jgi:hypothetical protein
VSARWICFAQYREYSFFICRGADDAASAAGGGGGGGGGGSMVRPRDNECGRADRETKRPKHV